MASSTLEIFRRTSATGKVDLYGKMDVSTRVVGFTENKAVKATTVTTMEADVKGSGSTERERNGLNDSLKLLTWLRGQSNNLAIKNSS